MLDAFSMSWSSSWSSARSVDSPPTLSNISSNGEISSTRTAHCILHIHDLAEGSGDLGERAGDGVRDVAADRRASGSFHAVNSAIAMSSTLS